MTTESDLRCTSRVFTPLDVDRHPIGSRIEEYWYVCPVGSDTPASSYVYRSEAAAEYARRHWKERKAASIPVNAIVLDSGLYALSKEKPDLTRPFEVGECAAVLEDRIEVYENVEAAEAALAATATSDAGLGAESSSPPGDLRKNHP